MSPYQDAIENLPAGALLILEDVSWEDYEQILDEVGNRRPGLRFTYDHGRLEVMSPHFKHEQCKEFILRLFQVIATELHIALESAGSTTWKNKEMLRGLEPDTSLYIQRADAARPPDLAVEIDVTNESVRKLYLYAQLGVPEVWIYSSKPGVFSMHVLRDGTYAEVVTSAAIPILTSEILLRLMQTCERSGQTEALSEFRSRFTR